MEAAASEFVPAVRDGKAAQETVRPSLSYWTDAWLRLRKNRQAAASLFIVALILLFILVGPLVWRVDPSEQITSRTSEAPSLAGHEVVVADDLPDWEIPTVPDPKGVDTPGAELPAPANLKLQGIPSPTSVRLVWDPVPGADEGYVIYRNNADPAESDGNLGIPVGQTDGPGRVGHQDSFDLKARPYWYSVVAKNVDESRNAATLKVDIQQSIPLAVAQSLDPEVKAGQKLNLPPRPLGTDDLGRDMLARLMAGGRVSLFIGIVAALCAAAIGITIGGISGFLGGKVDDALMRLTDFVLALPFLLFMILFRVASGVQPGEGGVGPMMLALVLLSWTGPARLTRGQVLQLRESEFVQAARLLGAKPFYLIFRHLVPNTLGIILVSFTFAIPSAIFTEAFLSFLGMGVVPPTPSWGSMCDDGVKTFLNYPHQFIFPAGLISITVLAFNLLGDGLRDALDPKMRGKS